MKYFHIVTAPTLSNRNRLRRRRGVFGFSLLELMVVVAIMATAVVCLRPAVSSLAAARNFSQGSYQIASALEEARTYAMSHNTYVYAGLSERDGVNSQLAGKGRVILVVMASKDGTCCYDVNSPAAINASQLLPISKPIVMNGLQLVDSSKLAGKVQFPSTPLGTYDVSTMTSATPFSSQANGSSDTYTYQKVIQFDPRGVARIQTASNGDEVPVWIELGLREIHGNTTPANAQSLVIQVAGVSGSVKVYRQ